MPEIFTKVPLEIIESPFWEKEFHHARYGKMIDYIRVYRYLYQLFCKKGYDKEVMPRGLHMLERIISEFRSFRENDFSQLTIEQIDDLLWYINLVGDKRISKEIKEVLHQYLKRHRHRDTPFFNEIFNLY